jgi:hypothetical protein
MGYLLTILLVSGTVSASDIGLEKLKLANEAQAIEVRSHNKAESFEKLHQKMIEEAVGNPSIDEYHKMMADYQRHLNKRDKLFLFNPVPQFETNENFLKDASVPSCEGPDLEFENGSQLKMISYSLIYNEGGKGMARFGHIMQRFEYCRDGKYFTFVFTQGPLDSEKVRKEAAKEHDLSDGEIVFSPKQKGGVLFSWMLHDLKKDFYRRTVTENRTLYEVQFDVTPEEMYKALLFNMARQREQKELLLKGELLPRYSAMRNSCNKGFLDTINYLFPGYTDNGIQMLPKKLFEYSTERLAKRVIVYPRANPKR